MYTARLKKGNENFEIVVDPEKAIKVKQGLASIREALLYPKIYSDARKGELASEQRLQTVFGTKDPLVIAEKIIKEGEVQLTQEYRLKLLEDKKKQIVELIRKLGIDPRTGAPHTQDRIESAIAQAKIRIDEFKPAEVQVKDVLKAIKPIIPIALVKKRIELIIPAQYSGKCYGLIKSFCQIVSEDWSDSNQKLVVEIPGGLELELYEKLNQITKGALQSKLIEKIENVAS